LSVKTIYLGVKTMTMMDIGQFPKIDSDPQGFKLNWHETKLFPFRYSEGVHYFIQKDQEWIVDEVDKWIKENYFKEDFPSVIDWKLKLTYQSIGLQQRTFRRGHLAILTCENRQNAKFKFGFRLVVPNTDIELYYGGDRIDEVSFCLLTNPDPSGMMLMLEEEWVYLLSIASRLFT
jgi:hypothetical protein